MTFSLLKRLVAAAMVLSPGICHAGDDEVVRTKMDALLKASYPATRPGASIIVVRDGHVVFRGAYGLANVELGVPSDPAMVYGIGSMTKQFTAAAVLLLAHEGKLRLDADIRSYLPDLPDTGPMVTVEQLLNHTSGIKNYFEIPSWRATIRDDTTPEKLLQSFANAPRDFEPGTAWHYSNSNYALLGAIIERVSGLSYGDFMRTRLFQPLGMDATTYPAPGDIVPRRVAGYGYRAGKLVGAAYASPTQMYSAAGMVSSVDDLARWNANLDSGNPIPRELIQQAWKPGRLRDGTSTGYGYGWATWTWRGHKVVGHDGNIYGALSAMARFPDDHLFVAVLANATGSGVSADEICMRLASIALGVPPQAAVAVTLEPSVLEDYTGMYRGGNSEVWRVRRKDGGLEFRKNDEDWNAGFATSATTFVLRKNQDVMRFESLRDGVPSQLVHEGDFTGIERARRVRDSP